MPHIQFSAWTTHLALAHSSPPHPHPHPCCLVAPHTHHYSIHGLVGAMPTHTHGPVTCARPTTTHLGTLPTWQDACHGPTQDGPQFSCPQFPCHTLPHYTVVPHRVPTIHTPLTHRRTTFPFSSSFPFLPGCALAHTLNPWPPFVSPTSCLTTLPPHLAAHTFLNSHTRPLLPTCPWVPSCTSPTPSPHREDHGMTPPPPYHCTFGHTRLVTCSSGPFHSHYARPHYRLCHCPPAGPCWHHVPIYLIYTRILSHTQDHITHSGCTLLPLLYMPRSHTTPHSSHIQDLHHPPPHTPFPLCSPTTTTPVPHPPLLPYN